MQETLVGAFVSIGAVVISCFVVTVVSHSGDEEQDGRTEAVLATATERSTVFVAVALVALVGAAWLLAGHRAGDGDRCVRLTGGRSRASWRPSWCSSPLSGWSRGLGLVALAQGSRYAVLGWAFVVAFFVVGPVAELLKLPGWVAGLSPYSHVPKVPAEPFAWTPELVLTAIATVLVATAWWRYRERDIG